MSKNKGGEQSKYSDDYRKEVAEYYLSNVLSYREVQIKFDLPTRGLVPSFVSWYKRSYDLQDIPLAIEKNKLLKPCSTSNSEQARLLSLLSHAKLKIESLETMINIAEQNYNIDIRKKFGAKSSKK